MTSKIAYKSNYSLLLGIFILVVLIAPKLVVLPLVASFILVIIGVRKKEIVAEFSVLPALFIALYCLYVIYCLFSRHLDIAFKYLEYKLVFLILPLFFFFRLKQQVNFKWINYFYLVAIVVLLLENWIGSIQCYLSTEKGMGCFLTSGFSAHHHPSYQAVYYTLALLSLWYGYKSKHRFINGFIFWGGSVLLVISIVLCLSLAGLLYLFALIIVLILRYIYLKFGLAKAILSAVVAPLAIGFAAYQVPNIASEVDTAVFYATKYLENPQEFIEETPEEMSGTETRLVMWTTTAQIIADYPNGLGTGNVDEVLKDYLSRAGKEKLAEHDYNPHNQFLQTWVEIGWIGALLLVLLISYGCYFSWKNRNYLLLLLITNLFFNMLFESMLQRQSGIIFYTFAICFAAVYCNKQNVFTQVAQTPVG